MKRRDVLRKLQKAARKRGLEFTTVELSRHTVRVGSTTHTLGRHGEVPDVAAHKFFDEFANELGKGWWR